MASKPKNPNSQMAKYVRAVRETLGLNQEKFADLFDCGKGNVSAWENGRHSPSYDQLRLMSTRSGLTLPGDVPPPSSDDPAVLRLIMAFGWLTDAEKKKLLSAIEAQAEGNKTIARELGPKWQPKSDEDVERAGIKAAPKSPTVKKHKKAGHDGGRPPSAPLDDYPDE